MLKNQQLYRTIEKLEEELERERERGGRGCICIYVYVYVINKVQCGIVVSWDKGGNFLRSCLINDFGLDKDNLGFFSRYSWFLI